MNKQEFEQRIGRVATSEEFERAEAIYMMAINLNKDEFCAEWDVIKDSETLSALSSRCDQLEKAVVEKNKKLDGLLCLMSKTDYGSSIDEEVRGLVGAKRWIVEKLNNGTELSAFDIQYIKNNL